MPEIILQDGFVCIDGYDISGVSNSLPFKWTQEIKEWICFKPPEDDASDALARKRLPGAESAELPVGGYLDFGSNYLAATAGLGVSDMVITFAPTRTPGDRCYLFPATSGEFSFGGPVGDVVPMATDLKSNGIVVPATIFDFGEKTATGSGTPRTLGAVSSTRSLYAHVHVVGDPAGTTPSLAVILESSALGDFTDAVTRFTFTSFTARGRQRAVIAGPITDTHYRFRVTVGGTGSPLFRVRFSAGIR
jgi:hypothetical protein